MFDLEAHGVALVGDVPSGLPAPELPSFDLVKEHIATIGVAAIALLLIGFSQTAGDARAFAARHKYPHRRRSGIGGSGHGERRRGRLPGHAGLDEPLRQLAERVGRGEDAAGVAHHRRARPADAALPRAALLQLPKPVLAAVIIDAVVFGMIDVGELRRLYRVTRFDFWIAVAAIVAVLSAGVLAGVVIGMVLSLGWLIYVATRPPMPLLGREPGTQVFRDLDENPGDETFPGVVVLRLDSGLFFATSQALEDRVRALTQDGSPPRALVLDLEGVNFIDSQGAEQLAAILELVESSGATLRLARVKPSVLAVLRADGFVDRLGADRIHGNVDRAVEAQLQA